MKRCLEFFFPKGLMGSWFPIFGYLRRMFSKCPALFFWFVTTFCYISRNAFIRSKDNAIKFLSIKELWCWSAFLYNMSEGPSLFQVCSVPNLKHLQWGTVSSIKLSGSSRVTGQNHFFLDRLGGGPFFLTGKQEEPFPGHAWPCRGCWG